MTYGYGYTIDRETLDFGTPNNPCCGFCKTPCYGKWNINVRPRGGEPSVEPPVEPLPVVLEQQCKYCIEQWYLDDEANAFYIRSNIHRAAISILSLKYNKSCDGFEDVPLLEWFFYYDHTHRRKWLRRKYSYCNFE